MPEQRNHLIDLLRFLSALAVAFYHFNQPIPYIDNWYRNLLKAGYLGVPVFFVISGYAIALSASRSKGAGDFLLRRIFRIFPPYYTSLLIVLLTIVVFKIANGVNDIAVLPGSPEAILATFTLLTSPFSNVPVINWVYWTLTYELFFYVTIALCLLVSPKRQIIVQILISIAALVLPTFTGGPLFFLKYWPLFSLGTSVFYISNEKSIVVSLCLAVINLAALGRLFLAAGDVPTFAATIITLALIRLSFKHDLKPNIFSQLGDLSYSMYLLHVPLGIYLLGQLKTKNIQEHLPYNILFDIFCYLIVLFFSLISFRFIEKPGIRVGKVLGRRLVSKT